MFLQFGFSLSYTKVVEKNNAVSSATNQIQPAERTNFA